MVFGPPTSGNKPPPLQTCRISFQFVSLCSCYVKRGQPKKHQLYSGSKKVALFYTLQMQWQVRYPPSILVIPEDGFVIFIHIRENYFLNDSLHITPFSSQWLFAPSYKTEEIYFTSNISSV
jgi:hypothetical protein